MASPRAVLFLKPHQNKNISGTAQTIQFLISIISFPILTHSITCYYFFIKHLFLFPVLGIFFFANFFVVRNLPETGIFNNQPVAVPAFDFSSPYVLGETANSDKWIEVNLANQQATAYENGQKVFEFLISSGTWGRTPTGTFKIWTKIKSQKMSGGSKENGTYYYLPNVPYIMFFYNDSVPKSLGFSFHGTYWHDNFGVPMSHGCINMKTAEAKMLFDWAQVDTPVFIYGKYSPPST